MATATGSIRASGAHAATTPTRRPTIRPKPDAHEKSPCSRPFSSALLMHFCSGKRCIFAPALTLFDMAEMKLGRRKELWHGAEWSGWRWAERPERRAEFIKRHAELRHAADEQLSAFRVFVTEIDDRR